MRRLEYRARTLRIGESHFLALPKLSSPQISFLEVFLRSVGFPRVRRRAPRFGSEELVAVGLKGVRITIQGLGLASSNINPLHVLGKAIGELLSFSKERRRYTPCPSRRLTTGYLTVEFGERVTLRAAPRLSPRDFIAHSDEGANLEEDEKLVLRWVVSALAPGSVRAASRGAAGKVLNVLTVRGRLPLYVVEVDPGEFLELLGKNWVVAGLGFPVELEGARGELPRDFPDAVFGELGEYCFDQIHLIPIEWSAK